MAVRDRAVASALRGPLAERARFLRSFLSGPRRVGAILPTSRTTVRTMLELAPVSAATCVVELGAGTGPLTRELVGRLAPGAQALAFEIDPVLAEGLRQEIADPRLRVVADSAEHLETHLDGRRPEAIFSALPFTSLPKPVGRRVLDAARRVLAPGGAMVVLQYSPLIERELRRTFGTVERRLSLPNVPPAFLYTCRP
jgi:phospholipid N-methyltransferase